MSSFSLIELERRLANLIRVATIESVDTAAATCRVRIGELVTGDLPWLTARAGDTRSWSAPDVGEQVLVVSPFGDLAQGIVLPSLYQAAHPAPESSADIKAIHYKYGTVVAYDEVNHKLTVDLPDAASDVEIKSAGTVHITTTGDTFIKAENANVEAVQNIKVKAGADVIVDGTNILLNSGDGVVTKAHICALTGMPHSDGSATVKAGQ